MPTQNEHSKGSHYTLTAHDLIQRAKGQPREAIIDSLLYVGDVCLIHAPEESFKSVFVLVLALSLATIPASVAGAASLAGRAGQHRDGCTGRG